MCSWWFFRTHSHVFITCASSQLEVDFMSSLDEICTLQSGRFNICCHHGLVGLIDLFFWCDWHTHVSKPAYVYQIEPGSQTEQPPPSAVFRLGPEDMHGFRFLTISVAPRPVLLAFILFIKISLLITSCVLHWRSNSKFLLPVWYFFLANLSIWYLFSSHGCLFLSINKKIHAMPLLFTLLMTFTFYFSVMEV